MRDIVKFKGEMFEIESGLTEEEVLESMKQLFPSAADASVRVEMNADGSKTWHLTDKPGEKG